MTLRRVLTSVDAGWLVAGNMIGAGIFLTPGYVAGYLPGLAWPLLAWVAGGLLALAGAAIYAELGARIPRAGGDYQYLCRAFGPAWGFLTGWAALILTFSAAAAAMCLVSVGYLVAAVWPGRQDLGWTAPLVAPLLVVLLTWANTAGARFAGRTTVLLTGVPLVGLIVVFGFGLLSGSARISWPAEPLATPPGSLPLAFGAALVPVFFTYSGWNAAAYLAGELREPGRALARGLLLGTAAVCLLYLLVNVVLLGVLGDELAGAETPGAVAAGRLLGAAGERALALIVAVAILGSANVTLMAGARVYYAMAVDGLAPRGFARTGTRGVPSTALWAGGIWCALLAASGRVGALISGATLAILLLSSLTVAALFVLRRRDPGGTPFRCPGYPWTPAIYLIASLGVAVASAIEAPRASLLWVLAIGAGLPLYLLFRRTAAPHGPE